MKFSLAILLLIGLAGTAVFGIFGMDMGHGSQSAHSGCIAAVAKGMDCPYEFGSLPYLAFHLDAYKNFSKATVSGSYVPAWSAFLALLAAAVYGFAVLRQNSQEFFGVPHEVLRLFGISLFSARRGFFRWIALHENSPQIF